MIKIDISHNLINLDEELTKEKCIEYIKTIKTTMKETRINVYRLFLGPTAFKYTLSLILLTLITAFTFEISFFIILALIELIGYLIFAVCMSEYMTKKLKQSLKLQLIFLQQKLSSFQ